MRLQRNQESRFEEAATVKMPRSTFLMHQNIRTTFNAGQLIPFYVDSDIMPGDTFKVKGTFVVRQSTPIYPTMDNSFLDVFFFFIPHRLVWEHWKEFWGENSTGSWTQTTSYTIPQMEFAKTNFSSGVSKGDWANYMGIPLMATSTNGFTASALPFRAYALTWNEWFRDENVTAPIYVYKGDAINRVGATSTNTWGNYYSGNSTVPTSCAPVYKYKDYFNACLPEPQKGGAITLPIGQSAPVAVFGTGYALGLEGKHENLSGTTVYTGLIAQGSDGLGSKTTGYNQPIGTATTGDQDVITDSTMGVSQDATKSGLVGIADLSNAVAATINAQRMAFAAQRILEAKARTGSRYTEIIRGLFSVTSPDARQQRPEYLGGKRLPISMNQVAQTSSTDNTSPQGNVAAFSLTVDSDHMFTKSFTEHGTILGLLCVRQEHSYDQGLARMWSRKNILDFYTPQMAFLGEQAVLNKEIYLTGTATDDQVFGYNERWAELRYKPNINTGMFSTQYATSLDSWHYGDSYSALPVLSDAWRRETKDYIDRTLAVQSSVEDQYLMDSRLEFVATRPVPLTSIPGLLDHF